MTTPTELNTQLHQTLTHKVELLQKKRNIISAKVNHLDFIKYTWLKSQDDPFIPGYHSEKICEVIDQAIKKYQMGESVFIRIKIHHRAGKSDIVSRYLPAHLIGLFPDKETLLVSHGASLASQFAKFGRRLIENDRYRDVFPEITLSSEKKAANDWEIMNNGNLTQGRVFANGLMSGLSGNGYSFGIMDDYNRNRQSAESQVQRDNMWEAFVNDFLTRRAPTSITIVLATQWNDDDIHGRIEKKNDISHDDYDPDFPQFELLSFPAKVSESEYKNDELWKKYDFKGKKYLFQERFDEKWYNSQYSSLGAYASSAMMDCNPIPRAGGILDVSRIKWYDNAESFPKNLTFIRVWDFAHTAKTAEKKDPDFTGGTLLAYNKIGYNNAVKLPIVECYVLNYFQTRETAVKRDTQIVNVMMADGILVKQVIETSIDSMDGYHYLKQRVNGVLSVFSINIHGKNKVIRCEPIVPMFEVGNVHVIKSEWNGVWLDALRRFDGSGKTHDEPVDNLTAGYEFQIKRLGYKPLKVRLG